MAYNEILVVLPPDMFAQVQGAIATGEYASMNDLFQDALNELFHKRDEERLVVSCEDQLKRAWQEAVSDNGPYLDADTVFDDLEARYQAMADEAATAR